LGIQPAQYQLSRLKTLGIQATQYKWPLSNHHRLQTLDIQPTQYKLSSHNKLKTKPPKQWRKPKPKQWPQILTGINQLLATEDMAATGVKVVKEWAPVENQVLVGMGAVAEMAVAVARRRGVLWR
jgi:hypothetical protein